jgi:hypothetical protein
VQWAAVRTHWFEMTVAPQKTPIFGPNGECQMRRLVLSAVCRVLNMTEHMPFVSSELTVQVAPPRKFVQCSIDSSNDSGSLKRLLRKGPCETQVSSENQVCCRQGSTVELFLTYFISNTTCACAV